MGGVIEDTPIRGYNSDATLFVDSSKIYVLWREVHTPLCDSLGCKSVVVGRMSVDGKHFGSKKVYIMQHAENAVKDICPIVMKRNDTFYIYTTWYYRQQPNHDLGIAIWGSPSLENPDFSLNDTIYLPEVLTVDKWKQFKIGDKLLFIPKPHKFDMWHFDLFEYENKLYMVASEEKGDVIMLGVSADYQHFAFYRKPLINNHCMEKHVGYRQVYYKPTAVVKNDTLHLLYTTNPDQRWWYRNVLQHGVIPINQIAQ